jgi:hypothetical protein
MWLRYLVPVASAALLLYFPQIRAAELGAVEFAPKFGPGQPLTIEVRNLSKLPVRLNGAILKFPASGSASPCSLRVEIPAVIPPATLSTVNLAKNRDVLADIPQMPASEDRSCCESLHQASR